MSRSDSMVLVVLEGDERLLSLLARLRSTVAVQNISVIFADAAKESPPAFPGAASLSEYMKKMVDAPRTIEKPYRQFAKHYDLHDARHKRGQKVPRRRR